ncbi:MAG TPA: SDR family NAD(P)-dependent oxidoreductase [Ignavibacteria bacterium]|nr:short-chain dehydrogenase [Bacteroidota bacterium]HRI85764.1 SDR family NAD(P)-dependent oxidoreductase [Ignavibacteria bacterium]HRK00256.1 SDR family NAD(P)-dependent oxidoreductase [Ignavibacteria bacterium]
MNYFFITGTSRGIGKALAELLLRDDSNFVYGFSRSNNINAENYKHSEFDLSDTEKVMEFEFPDFKDADSITLVNNSAAAMEVKRMGKLSSDNIVDVYNVNLISPSLLMNNFIKMYQKQNCKRIIMNISSGAAHKAIESWSVYCAAKAGLAMISQVADAEQKLKHPNNPVRIYSFGPGVVNTQMQTKLRKVSPEDFSMVGRFIDFYKKNELAEPEDVAVKINQILQSPEKFEKVIISIKEI